MKKLLLLAGLALSFCFGAKATNYFTAGTEWINIHYTGCATGIDEEYYEYYFLENSQKSDAPGLALYLNSTYLNSILNKGKHQIGWIKTEDDKVYFMLNNDPNWYLMYDFSLKPGESALVYSIDGRFADGSIYSSEIQCVEVVENNPDYHGFPTMLMQTKKEPEDFDEYPEFRVNWIVGIGSEIGFSENYRDYGWIGSKGGWLLSVKHNGNLVFTDYPAGVENIETGASKQAVNPTAPVYDLTGRVVGKHADLDALPAGIYISNGRKILK